MRVFLIMGGTEQLRRRIVGRRFSDNEQYLIFRPGRKWEGGDNLMDDKRKQHLSLLTEDIAESLRISRESGHDVVSMFAGDPDERKHAIEAILASETENSENSSPSTDIRLFGIWISNDNRRNAPQLGEGYDVLQYDSYIPDPRDERHREEDD